jgi:hypothetical protein
MALLVHGPVSVFDLRCGRRPAILTPPTRSLDAEVLFIHFALVRSLTGADDPRLGLETVDFEDLRFLSIRPERVSRHITTWNRLPSLIQSAAQDAGSAARPSR